MGVCVCGGWGGGVLSLARGASTPLLTGVPCCHVALTVQCPALTHGQPACLSEEQWGTWFSGVSFHSLHPCLIFISFIALVRGRGALCFVKGLSEGTPHALVEFKGTGECWLSPLPARDPNTAGAPRFSCLQQSTHLLRDEINQKRHGNFAEYTDESHCLYSTHFCAVRSQWIQWKEEIFESWNL